MKPTAVLVETNWVVDVVAPAHLQSQQAAQLLSRANNGEFELAVLAAILVRAEDLRQKGHSWVGFCELDSDLQPWDKSGAWKPSLRSLYDASRVWVYADFLVEDIDKVPQEWIQLRTPPQAGGA
ncbi:MAG: hypothetical protein VKJ46_15845 [Leptolyngbyaceae bacterium]|nr:hypothetical protein [Leptolyngbyaceae bacterium]